ncbi:hypothetical protein Pmani_036194 [Petrolisthes manimaculis]|uniref:Uncharacterized protein n=1 Tax=Petrolisthes manimaculis TaxID=1843537 RepID=A0AAE1TPM9_9EUCA|nr:hypothetical protein Pmani_036194 [Petrolisthes manimaculis]
MKYPLPHTSDDGCGTWQESSIPRLKAEKDIGASPIITPLPPPPPCHAPRLENKGGTGVGYGAAREDHASRDNSGEERELMAEPLTIAAWGCTPGDALLWVPVGEAVRDRERGEVGGEMGDWGSE